MPKFQRNEVVMVRDFPRARGTGVAGFSGVVTRVRTASCWGPPYNVKLFDDSWDLPFYFNTRELESLHAFAPLPPAIEPGD